jgi:glycosyltransferase involved in cell wall biosynthesis
VADRIAGIVIARNEASNIGACLASLDFCDVRLVVDSFSDDRTVELACETAELVVRRSFVNHAEQKNWAARQVDTDWVLFLDADERIPDALKAEIQECVRAGQADAWWLRRSNWFFGRFIRGAGWSRDRVLRLYRRQRGRYDEREVHEEVRMDPGCSVDTCRHRLLHYSYVDWDSTFGRFLGYSRGGARDRWSRGRRGSIAAVLTRPGMRFLRQYLTDGGWRDGLHGLVLCQWSAAGVFLRESRLLIGEPGDEVVNRGSVAEPRVEWAKGSPSTGPARGEGTAAPAGE